MKKELKKLLKKAVPRLQKEKEWGNFVVSEINIDFPKDERVSDYLTNIAMVLAKIFKKIRWKLLIKSSSR